MARKTEDRCFVKAGENEMIFVLRAQDRSSPKLVVQWIAENIETVTDEHARDALETALTMKREGNNGLRKNPD